MHPRITLLILAILSTSACLNMPLLNYAKAAPRLAQPTQPGLPDACAFHFTKLDTCASLTWTKEPTEDSPGAYTLRFWNAQQGTEHGPYLEPAGTVFTKLWMPSMGHGSSPITLKQTAPGVYEATGVYFVMPGAWEIWIEIKNGQSVIDRAKIEVEI